ncbi:hypothetical protein [Paenibacillus sp. CMAA1364]
MQTKLMNETFRLLQIECSPQARISLDGHEADMLVAASLLTRYELTDDRRLHLSVLYIVLHIATIRHKNCDFSDPDLTRKVLDGDYLYSLYIQLALQYKEFDLITFLAPRIKKWQIQWAEGDSEVELLSHTFEQYLNVEFQRDVTYTSVEQVG